MGFVGLEPPTIFGVRVLALGVYLNPEEPTFLRTYIKEIIIRNPKQVGSSGLRQGFGVEESGP